MEFGRPNDPAAVDWSLPPDTALTREVLGGRGTGREVGAAALYIGSTAWGQRGFVGSVYPAGTKPGDYLAAYGRQFNCVELNASYYRTPDFRQLRRWYAAVPDDFRFCPKVSKGVSQAGDLSADTSRALDFAKAVQHLAHKCGPCFLQLPRDFGVGRVDVLRDFLERWPPQVRLAVELRHSSWFATDTGLELFADLATREIGAVVTDVGGRRDAAHMNVTADFAFVRWVGTARPDSDESRLAAWADRVTRWVRAGLREVYFAVHQPEELTGARAAARFAALVRDRCGPVVATRAPSLRDADEGASGGGEPPAGLFG